MLEISYNLNFGQLLKVTPNFKKILMVKVVYQQNHDDALK